MFGEIVIGLESYIVKISKINADLSEIIHVKEFYIVHERNIGNISESSYFERLKMIGLFGDKDISISLGSTDSGTKLYILTDIGIKFYEVLNKYNE